MVDEALKARMREIYRRYAATVHGFSPRRGQAEMIVEVARTLSPGGSGGEEEGRASGRQARVALIEGPTGTGKTLSYLIGALPVAQALNKKLVIATATVALQEQLIGKDIPQLLESTGIDAVTVIAKGRGRYVCPSRLAFDTAPKHPDLFGGQAVRDQECENCSADELMAAFEAGQWDGERDSWPEVIPDPLWSRISTDSRGCTGRLCGHFAACPFYRARETMKDADIIVTNHDLVFSAYQYETDALPSQEETLFVFDEAHRLPAKALQYTESSFQVGAAIEAVGALEGSLFRSMHLLPAAARLAFERQHDTARSLAQLTEDLRDLRTTLDRADPLARRHSNGPTLWRFPFGEVPQALLDLGKRISESATPVKNAAEDMSTELRESSAAGAIERNAAEGLVAELAERIAGLDAVVSTWDLFATETEQLPMARWVEAREGLGGVEYRVAASPISAAGLLKRILWSLNTGVILTSATLTALGEFRRFAEMAGVACLEGVRYLRLPSPFDFQRNALLDIPRLKAEPRNAEAHTYEIIQWLNANIDRREGTLVLFTSYRQMNDAFAALHPDIKRITLVQGQSPKAAMLAAHREAIDAGRGAVLFGVDSLAEGVDLPGRYLSHVVIAKLPFSVPNTPVLEAMAEWLEANGRNPFLEMAVPDVSTKLTQAVGRLLRTETDTGRISILDKRILTKSYGRRLLAALPAMSRAPMAA